MNERIINKDKKKKEVSVSHPFCQYFSLIMLRLRDSLEISKINVGC